MRRAEVKKRGASAAPPRLESSPAAPAVPSPHFIHLRAYRRKSLERIRDHTTKALDEVLRKACDNPEQYGFFGPPEPESWRQLQGHLADAMNADAAINAIAIPRAPARAPLDSCRGDVIQERRDLWRAYLDAMNRYIQATYTVEHWAEVTARALSTWALNTTSLAWMVSCDDWLSGFEAAAYGAPMRREDVQERQGKAGTLGGKAGKGIAKRQHTQLIYRIVAHNLDANVGRDVGDQLGAVLDALEDDRIWEPLACEPSNLSVVGVSVSRDKKAVTFEFDNDSPTAVLFGGVRACIKRALEGGASKK